MNGVKRYALCPYNDHGCFSPHMAELNTFPDPASRTAYVLASDYDRDTQALKERLSDRALDQMRQLEELIECQTERDALRAQVEAVHVLLSDARRYVEKAWPDGVHSYRANSVSGDLLGKIDAALQAKP